MHLIGALVAIKIHYMKMDTGNTNCPRPGEQCNEFMCGSSVDGICHIENNCDFVIKFMTQMN